LANKRINLAAGMPGTDAAISLAIGAASQAAGFLIPAG